MEVKGKQEQNQDGNGNGCHAFRKLELLSKKHCRPQREK